MVGDVGEQLDYADGLRGLGYHQDVVNRILGKCWGHNNNKPFSNQVQVSIKVIQMIMKDGQQHLNRAFRTHNAITAKTAKCKADKREIISVYNADLWKSCKKSNEHFFEAMYYYKMAAILLMSHSHGKDQNIKMGTAVNYYTNSLDHVKKNTKTIVTCIKAMTLPSQAKVSEPTTSTSTVKKQWPGTYNTSGGIVRRFNKEITQVTQPWTKYPTAPRAVFYHLACKKCNGVGKVSNRNWFMKGRILPWFKTTEENCKKCNGTGQGEQKYRSGGSGMSKTHGGGDTR